MKESKLIQSVEKNRNSLSTDKLDMSFGELLNMYERAEIIIDPIFQRLFRWDLYQRTRLIESILVGIPVPPIFVAEKADGVWELVDGLQRISTIASFFGVLKKDNLEKPNNKWKLEQGELIAEFEGLTCNDLPLKLQLNIKRAVCRVEVIKWNSLFDMRFELFNRLNTGGSSLTNQEIRNCIFRGVSETFNNFLKEISSLPTFIGLICPTEKQQQELYVDELVLRFCALSQQSAKVTDNLENFLTNYMKKAVEDVDNIPVLKDLMIKLISIFKPLGPDIFKGNNRLFASSIYDCLMVGVASYIDQYDGNDEQCQKIMEIKNKLINSTEFKDASGSATASRSRINKRLILAKKYFDPKYDINEHN